MKARRKPQRPTDVELLREIAEGLDELCVVARVSGWLISEQKISDLQAKVQMVYLQIMPRRRGRPA